MQDQEVNLASDSLLSTSLEPEVLQPPQSKQYVYKLVVSLVIAGGFLWLLKRGGLPVLPAQHLFHSTRWWAVGIYCVMSLLAFHFRCTRWVYFLRPVHAVPSHLALGIGYVNLAAIFLAPLRMGELLRPYMISRRSTITFAQATGTVAAERIIDGLIVAVLLFLGLQTAKPLSQLPTHLGDLPLPVAAIPALAYSMVGVFVMAFVTMAVFYWRRAFARRMTELVLGVVSKKLASWVALQVEHLADGFRFLPRVQAMFPIARDTVFYWVLHILSIWVLLQACGIPASISMSCVVMGTVGMGVLVPAGPGFFGAFQLSGYAGLALYFPIDVVVSSGAVFVFLMYTTHLSFSLMYGVIGWLMVKKSDLNASQTR